MDRKRFIANWLERFGLIHGFSMMMVYLITSIYHNEMTFTVSFLGQMILFSLAATLPGMIYYTNRDMSEREWWIRTIIHYVLLNVVLLPIAQVIGLWKGIAGCFMFMGVILVIDILVHALSFGRDWVVARDINTLLKQRFRESQEEEK